MKAKNITDLNKKIKAAAGKEKVELLNELASKYKDKDPEKCEQYAKQALELAKKINAKYLQAKSYNLIGISFHRKSKFNKAMQYYTKARQIYESLDMIIDKTRVESNIGSTNRMTANYDAALKSYFRALHTWEEIFEKRKQDESYLKDEISNSELRKHISWSYNNIGTIYSKISNYDKSLEYHFKSIKIRPKGKSQRDNAVSYTNIGNVYYFQNKLDKALEYHKKALEIKKKADNKRTIAFSYTSLGRIYKKNNDNKKAIEFYRKAKNIFDKISDKRGIAFCTQWLGILFYENENQERGLKCLHKSLSIAQEIGAKEIQIKVYSVLSKIWESKKDFEKALQSFKKYNSLKEEILNEKKSKKIAEMQAKYDTVKKQKELEIYRLKNIELKKQIKSKNEAQNKLKKSEQKYQKLSQKLKKISITDELTQVPNRRRFNTKLEQEWQRALREKKYIALLIFDIDHFKLYNDSFGHLQGDKLLKKIANSAKQIFQRPGDLFVRYGGDEFAAILPDTDKNGVLHLAEKCRERIENLEIEHKESPISDVVTITVGGCALSPSLNTNSQKLITCADKALYKAKKSGRNNISCK